MLSRRYSMYKKTKMYCGNIDIRQDSNNNKALTGILRPFKK
jgi:hypothetical protein